ncbi:hypothetical protein DPMN_054042 [Dreissena polymorpha]|uniref:SWIM-type domain-containing protein n=1 Tax=Dreissena polymorpha TaxID=45954 RepID=A0A9D4HR98_DREPO|nr:hypothetical protein DPMN_054042 [Dreissena polymorpha]
MHKHRPLVKPMIVVSTTGYIISILGPYLADGKNSDANILKHIINQNTEDFKVRSYIRFKEGSVDAWFCSCPVGARVVGTCAHVTSALWYLCFRRHQTDQLSDGPRNWAADISDAANVSY